MVRTKEEQAEGIAHVLDDVVRVPGTRIRIGADPVLGLIPVAGDAMATFLGVAILVIARQLNIPWRVVGTMAFNQLKNGLIGAVPIIGDAYSFYFKSNAVNTALLIRTVKHGKDGACPLTTRQLRVQDVVGLAILILPTIALVVLVGFWFWDHNISYVSIFFFPHFYEIPKG
jgi:hypothetical protein